MPEVKVVVIKSLEPYFKESDKLTIIPILYDEDTLIRREIWGMYKSDGTFLKIVEKRNLVHKHDTNIVFEKISDNLYAPKGSYKDSVIEMSDGRRYPSSIVRRFETYFEKI
jgi:hypothetical protein